MTDTWYQIDVWFPVVGILIFLIACCTVRLFRGPTAADRAIAVDTVNTLTIASMILLGVAYREIILIDVATYLHMEPAFYLVIVCSGVALGFVGSIISVARFIKVAPQM